MNSRRENRLDWWSQRISRRRNPDKRGEEEKREKEDTCGARSQADTDAGKVRRTEGKEGRRPEAKADEEKQIAF